MNEFFNQIDWSAMINAIKETLYMTFFSLLVAVLLGFVLGIILYIPQEDG